jgi:hypothetical protein
MLGQQCDDNDDDPSGFWQQEQLLAYLETLYEVHMLLAIKWYNLLVLNSTYQNKKTSSDNASELQHCKDAFTRSAQYVLQHILGNVLSWLVQLVQRSRDKYDTRSRCAGEVSPQYTRAFKCPLPGYKSKGYKSGKVLLRISRISWLKCTGVPLCPNNFRYLTASGTSTNRQGSNPFYRKSR